MDGQAADEAGRCIRGSRHGKGFRCVDRRLGAAEGQLRSVASTDS